MRIIQKGRVEPRVVRFTCRECGCIFEAATTIEAIRVTDQRDGDYYECKCPTCDVVCRKSA